MAISRFPQGDGGDAAGCYRSLRRRLFCSSEGVGPFFFFGEARRCGETAQRGERLRQAYRQGAGASIASSISGPSPVYTNTIFEDANLIFCGCDALFVLSLRFSLTGPDGLAD